MMRLMMNLSHNMKPDHKASLDSRENKALGHVRTKVHVTKNWRLGGG